MPLLTNVYFLLIYANNLKIVQQFIIYVVAIFSGLLAVYIFRENKENSSELLIFAKGISRYKIVLGKFLAFITCTLFFAAISACSGLLCFNVPKANHMAVVYLTLGLLAGNITCMLFFGAIAICLSLWLNKVVVVISNVLLIILSVIYTVSYTAASIDPVSKMTNDRKVVNNFNYINQNNLQTQSAFIASADTQSTDLLDLMSFEEQKKLYASYVDSNSYSALYQMSLLNWWINTYLVGPLKNIGNYRYSFAADAQLSFKITEPLVKTTIANINLTDDDYSWMQIIKNKQFPAFVIHPHFKRADVQTFVKWNDDPTQKPKELIKEINEILINTTVESLSPYSYKTYFPYQGSTQNFYTPNNPSNNYDGYILGGVYNGRNAYRNLQFFDNNFTFSDLELDIFNNLLYYALIDEDNEHQIWKNGSNLINKDYSYSLSSTGAHKYNIIRNLAIKLHDYHNELKINTPFQYSIERLKFIYYTYMKGTGILGFNDYQFKTEALKPNNGDITVFPWSQYFKFAYLPMYNSFNIRNIENYRQEWLPDFKVGPRNLFQHGNPLFLSKITNNNSDNKPNVLDQLITQNGQSEINNHTIDKALPVYDGNNQPDSDILKKAFGLFDITDEHESLSQIDGKYGYFSPAALKYSSLVEQLFETDGADNYYDPSWENALDDEHWNLSCITKFSNCETNLAIMMNGMFLYECQPIMTPTENIIFLLLASTCLIGLSFYKYMRYDFD